LDAGRKGYVQVVKGAVRVNGVQLRAGDAALLDGEPRIHLTGAEQAEVLVFDLASA
jgi:redox-sensitive bicupin YhaK (pirin superfamily)